ncbi:hypothetical protein EKH77_26795 [Streptomyces luteoverticillatus]|uniref:Phytoene synthase n=1 Tax=Streptomyces luteoverticillatus TaxID=66425 RepID=A0A3Q9G2B8_STRLT|nr:hypothetical protein EKH77_26795 [Streptomyces luteoverticillatus]
MRCCAYLHTAQTCGLSPQWALDQLEGMHIDIGFTGFTTEADYQAYVDAVTWPGAMITSGLIPHQVPDHDFAQTCRVLSDGIQRTDNLFDMADDLREGRMTLPTADLDRHGVTRRELALGVDTPGLRALLTAHVRTAREALERASRMFDEVPPEFAPSVRCLIGLYHHRLNQVVDRGVTIARTPVRDDPLTCLRLLASARTPVFA